MSVNNLDTLGHALAGRDEVAFAAATTGSANIFASVLTSGTASLSGYLTE